MSKYVWRCVRVYIYTGGGLTYHSLYLSASLGLTIWFIKKTRMSPGQAPFPR